MKQLLRILRLWCGIQLCFCAATTAQTTPSFRTYIALNINSCTFCNRSTSALVGGKTILDHASFLLSGDEVTKEQASEFVQELMGKPYPVTLDAGLYNQVAAQISFFKMPHLVVLDSMDRVVFKTPIDSIDQYKDIIRVLMPAKRKQVTYANTRLATVIGMKTINKVGSFLFVEGWQKHDRVYIYDLKQRTLDSLYFFNKDSILKLLLTLNGDAHINITKLKALYKTYDLPYSLVQFTTTAVTDEHRLYAMLDILYPPDPDHVSDTIDSKWGMFVFSYDPASRKLLVHGYNYWDSDSSVDNSYIVKDYQLDYLYQRAVNDSVWLFGGKRDDTKGINMGYGLDKPFFYFKKQKDGRLAYDRGAYPLFRYDSLVTFKGELMNRQGYAFMHKLEYPYLMFCQSPFIYNDENKQVFNVTSISKDIDWIFDMTVSRHVTRLLVQEQKKYVLYTLLRTDNRVLKREMLGPVSAKSNSLLDGDDVYYMNKNGEIILLKSVE